ncbi:Charged multivesicular body protein 7 [Rhizophlyctis rosea]|uniref:Charged multivesicular body protein 7 n=1 Tax=Rhizophlyctis rosea TaxID=64517 RepID=A0AAD5SBM7_9FUNG|nr:Charged multivesicular body protein 7 [Rhizophlyctis rosea]
MTATPLQEYLNTLPEWSNDAKMSSLFAAFPSDPSSNPAGYDARLRFWQTLLKQVCGRGYLSSNLLSMNVDALDTNFQRKRVTPLGMAVVLTHMVESGDLVPIDSFARSSSWTSWAFSTFVKRPVSWGFSQLVSFDSSAVLHGTYVVVPLVRESSERLLAGVRQDAHYQTDYLLSKDDLLQQYGKTAAPAGSTAPLSEVDLEILLRYLQKRLDIAISVPTADELITVIKVKSAKEAQTKTLVITEVDRGILTIKTTVRRLTTQVEQLESKITDLTRQAQERVRLKQKERALHAIRQKKAVTEVLKKRLGSLETIEAILQKIQSAETDAEIFSAYNVGADTLKQVLATSGLTVEVVEETMDKLQDALADQAEIDEAIVAGHESMAATNGIDDSELEQELDALLVQELEQLPAAATIPLPSTPTLEHKQMKEQPTKLPGTMKLEATNNRENDAALDAELDQLEEQLADQLASLSVKEQGKVNSSRGEESDNDRGKEAVLA